MEIILRTKSTDGLFITSIFHDVKSLVVLVNSLKNF